MAQINKPNTHFNPVPYTGNATLGKAITGVNFQPDFVWIKNRGSANGHVLHDVIRGVTKNLETNSNAVENTVDPLSSFDSDGFTLNGTGGGINDNGGTYASWNWKAGGTAVSNTDGSITSSVSANTTAGFSVVSYTGTGGVPLEVGHGLGVTPKMIIVKNRTNAYDWAVYHEALGNTGGLFLNTTSAFTTNGDLWNDTSPTSLIFTCSNSTLTNQGSANHIAYCFADVKGFSKFGSYTGNGNATDGPFIYTGFKPAFVLIKASNATEAWTITDDARDTYNPATKILYPSASSAEGSNTGTDYLSNGFKLRTGDGAMNLNSSTNYIYMAFAENPLVGTNGIPATAR